MNPPSGYTATSAKLVATFRTMQEHVACSRGREELVSSALRSLFRRLNDSATLDVLGQLPSLPQDIQQITIQFLAYCLRCSTETSRIEGLLRRFMKINLLAGSILEGANRVFNWLEQNYPEALHHQTSKPIKTWKGQSVLLGDGPSPLEGPNSECMITQAENFGWQVTAKTSILSYGFADSLEDAAESCYKAWYQHHTRAAFVKAKTPAAGRDIVLVGNNLSSQEYMAHAFGRLQSIVIAGTDRDPLLFVLNWPSITKDKRVFRVAYTTKTQIELTTGAKLDLSHMGLFFYMRKPEDHVGPSEFMCCKCRILGTVNTLDLRYCQGHGPLCGPCRDHLCELGELSDTNFD